MRVVLPAKDERELATWLVRVLEHAVLRPLITRSGEPLSKHAILDRLLSDEQDVQPDAVEVLVHRLRKRRHGTPAGIRTVRGLGYVLEPTNVSERA